MRILVVEDESRIANALKEGLEAESYEVGVACNGNDGFLRITTEHFDAAILDMMLPDRDGLEIIHNARKAGVQTPVLLLTARSAIQDRVNGLNAGADDYLTKPFAFVELLARIRALLRRGKSAGMFDFSIADLKMELPTRKVTRGGSAVELTGKEFELLEYLLRNQRETVARETLAREVWKETSRSPSLDNVIDVHIARLRKKINTDGRVKLIHTIRGVGFMLSDEEPGARLTIPKPGAVSNSGTDV